METKGFAAVVDGAVDARTVSSDLYSAKRLALFWVLNITTTMTTDESYVEFLWKGAVGVMLGRNPERSIELRPVVISVDERALPETEGDHAGETPMMRRARLTPGPQAREP